MKTLPLWCAFLAYWQNHDQIVFGPLLACLWGSCASHFVFHYPPPPPSPHPHPIFLPNDGLSNGGWWIGQVGLHVWPSPCSPFPISSVFLLAPYQIALCPEDNTDCRSCFCHVTNFATTCGFIYKRFKKFSNYKLTQVADRRQWRSRCKSPLGDISNERVFNIIMQTLEEKKCLVSLFKGFNVQSPHT